MDARDLIRTAEDVEEAVEGRSTYYLERYLDTQGLPMSPVFLTAWALTLSAGSTYVDLVSSATTTSLEHVRAIRSESEANAREIANVAEAAFDLAEGFDPDSHEPLPSQASTELQELSHATADMLNRGVAMSTKMWHDTRQIALQTEELRLVLLAIAGVGLLHVINSGEFRSWDETMASIAQEVGGLAPGAQLANIWLIVKGHREREKRQDLAAAQRDAAVRAYAESVHHWTVMAELWRPAYVGQALADDFPTPADVERACVAARERATRLFPKEA